jgi:hypothetical protein
MLKEMKKMTIFRRIKDYCDSKRPHYHLERVALPNDEPTEDDYRGEDREAIEMNLHYEEMSRNAIIENNPQNPLTNPELDSVSRNDEGEGNICINYGKTKGEHIICTTNKDILWCYDNKEYPKKWAYQFVEKKEVLKEK